MTNSSHQETLNLSQECDIVFSPGSPGTQDTTLVWDDTPSIIELDTPDMSLELSSDENQSSTSESDSALDSSLETASSILREISVKNVNRVMIGTLNINSLAPKFELLREVIGNQLKACL